MRISAANGRYQPLELRAIETAASSMSRSLHCTTLKPRTAVSTLRVTAVAASPRIDPDVVAAHAIDDCHGLTAVSAVTAGAEQLRIPDP
jgi:hypothetical protein